jgi:hypothetical protein
MEEKKKEIQKEVLKPITKVKSKEDKELQELEVESTGGGINEITKSTLSLSLEHAFSLVTFSYKEC